MSVRAKFEVRSKSEDYRVGKAMRPDGSYETKTETTATVVLVPVYGHAADPTSENAKFYAATPCGELKLSGIKPEVAALLEGGKAYYLDFTPAP